VVVSSQPQALAALPQGKEPQHVLNKWLDGPIESTDAYEENKPLITGVNRTPDPPSRSIVTIQNRQFRLPINFKTIFQNFLPPNTCVKSLQRIRHIPECAIGPVTRRFPVRYALARIELEYEIISESYLMLTNLNLETCMRSLQ